MQKFYLSILVLVFSIFGIQILNAQSVLEFAAGAGNPTGNGPTVSNQTITFQKNTDNPTGSTFAAFSPTTTATFALSNQQRTMTLTPNFGAMFGGTVNNSTNNVTAFSLFPLMNAIGGANNATFTSANSTAGTGIDITANRSVDLFLSSHPLQQAGLTQPTSATPVKYQYADLTVTFNNPVTNPIFHFAGCGANASGAAGNPYLMSAEFTLITSGLTLTRLSGSTEFTVPTSTTIINSATQYNAATGAGAMSGSVQVNGTNITSVTFRMYLSTMDNTSIAGSGGTDWDLNGGHSGDAFTVGVSLGICNAGTTAPPLSTTAVSACSPITSVNLNSYHTGTVPTGASLVWFTNNTHTGVAYATPTTAGAGTYYAFYYDSVNGCYSPASASITVTISNSPTVTTPATTPATYCQNATATALSVTGTAGSGTISKYEWYRNTTASTTGGTLVATNVSSATTNSYTPVTTATGTFYYYVVITNSNGCTTTSAVSGAVTVNAIPTIISTTAGSRCGTGTVTLGATASAGTINWYAAATGGTSLGTGTSFTTPSISATTTYYVDATNGSCTTATRTAVVATVNAIPTITTTTDGNRCGTGTVTLGATASAGTINWYAAATGGSSLGTGTSFTTPSISATTTYYVDATNGSCTTATRTAVVATVNATPTITATTAGSRCGTGTVTLGATASAGTINWYAAATGGTSLGTGTSFTTPSISATTTYYVDATNGSCTTATRTAVVATVNNCIDAVNDTYSIASGTSTASVIANDLNNGGTAAVIGTGAGQVSISTSTNAAGSAGAWPSGFTLNADGTIAVASGTTAGTYTLYYTICNQTAGSPCDTAAVTLNVTLPICASGITFINTGNNTTAGYTTQYALTDASGVIQYIGNTTTFAPIITGNYNAYAINYETTAGITGLTVGQNISGVTSTCFDIKGPLAVSACSTSMVDAQNDDNQVPSGSTASGSVLTNDSSIDGSATTVTAAIYLNASGVATPLPLGTATSVYDATGNLAGTMTLNSNGTYTFVPAANYSGTVPVNYTASNASGSNDTATLSIKVIPATTSGNNNPIAQNDTASTEVGTNVSSTVLSNDSDPDGNSLSVTSASITLGSATQVSGVDANGNTVANAGTLTLNSDGTYTFVPAPGFTGYVNLVTYTVSDGNGGTDTASLAITVLPNSGNNTFANDDANTAPKGSTMTGNALSNDTDPEGNTQSITSASANGTALTIGSATTIPGVGTLTLNSDGSYTFVPLSTFVGTLSIPYTVCDDGTPPACDTATLYLTSLGTNVCYKPAVTSGDILSTNHGITSLGRAGSDNGNWPMVRKGAWTVLEAKTKGFVVNRLTDAQITAIPTANLVEGMMVYNITQDCLQINVDGTAAGWKCFNTQACPD